MLDAARRPKVLVADCDRDFARLWSLRVSSFGCDALTTADGDEALRLFAEQQPDMVLLCMKLPPLSGYEVLRRMRASGDAGSKVPVVALGTCAMSSDFDTALEHGFDAVLSGPPGSPAQLREVLDRLLPRPRT